jgi:hypothetical protein
LQEDSDQKRTLAAYLGERGGKRRSPTRRDDFFDRHAYGMSQQYTK